MPLELPNNFVGRLQNGIIHVYTKPNLRLQDAQLFNRYHISFSNHHTMNLLNRFSLVFLTASTICYCGAVQPNPTKNLNYHLVSYLTETSTADTSDDINKHHSEKIAKMAIRYLKKQRQHNQRTLRQQKKQVKTLSEKLEWSISDAISKNILTTRSSIVGPNDEATGEGMSKQIQITQEPAPDYPYYSVRKVHKDLYDADVQLQQTQVRQAAVDYYLEHTDTLVSAIEQRRTSAGRTSVKEDWVQQQVGDLIQERL